MSVEFYKILHIIGLISLFTGIGGLIAYGSDTGQKLKLSAMLHGIGLVFLLISGFGMQAKLGYGFPGWILLKVVLWLGLGAMIPLAKRGVLSPRNTIILGLALGFIAAYAGLFGKTGFQIP